MAEGHGEEREDWCANYVKFFPLEARVIESRVEFVSVLHSLDALLAAPADVDRVAQHEAAMTEALLEHVRRPVPAIGANREAVDFACYLVALAPAAA